jgi:hypothetical protein
LDGEQARLSLAEEIQIETDKESVMERDIRETNGTGSNGVSQGYSPAQGAMPLRRRKIRVEVEVPEGMMGEFDLAVHEILGGARTRLTALEQEFTAIETRALAGLHIILSAVRASDGGQSARLVRFLASLYVKYDCPFELTDLRTLDTKLANACLDYLNYDRLGVCDLDRHLEDGGRELEGWMRAYGLLPLHREESR